LKEGIGQVGEFIREVLSEGLISFTILFEDRSDSGQILGCPLGFLYNLQGLFKFEEVGEGIIGEEIGNGFSNAFIARGVHGEDVGGNLEEFTERGEGGAVLVELIFHEGIVGVLDELPLGIEVVETIGVVKLLRV
jgi:hypothetical protein